MVDGRWERLKAVAKDGVFTRDAAVQAGYSKSAISWMLESQRWSRVHTGVFRFGDEPLTWRQRARAALCVAGAQAALSHDAAAHVLGLQGFEAPPAVIDVSCQPGRRVTARLDGVAMHHLRRRFRVVTTGVLPTTGWTRTLLNLAARLEPEVLEFTLDCARRRLERLPLWLRDDLRSARHGEHGAALVRALQRRRAEAPADSRLEVTVRRRLASARLPRWVAQHAVRHAGTHVMTVDFAWPAARVALHVDGFSWHSQKERFERDARQRRGLGALGWISLSVTRDDVLADGWLDDLRRALAPSDAGLDRQDGQNPHQKNSHAR